MVRKRIEGCEGRDGSVFDRPGPWLLSGMGNVVRGLGGGGIERLRRRVLSQLRLAYLGVDVSLCLSPPANDGREVGTRQFLESGHRLWVGAQVRGHKPTGAAAHRGRVELLRQPGGPL